MSKPTQPDHLNFVVENITVAKAALLKTYYWKCLDIDILNDKLKSGDDAVVHYMCIPTRQINSKPLKIVLWLRNCSSEVIELRLKRIQNCDCVPLQTRVGFNQFRQLYHCPHRRLINIMQEYIRMKPDDLVAMSVVAYFFLFGNYKLTYVLKCNDDRLIYLHFTLDIIGFDPQKCVITQELIPVDMREFRRFIQPIWVRNITMQEINFNYASRERGLKLINPNLIVPRLSVWPLMVEYRPTDYENQLDLVVSFNDIRTTFSVQAPGQLDGDITEPYVPNYDNECADYLYVLYPNKLEYVTELTETRSQMVSLHNYDQKCLEFRWQNYIINDLFEITFEPSIFRLKPHHSKLCVVIVHVLKRPLHFRKIPVVLEVHRIFDKSVKIAQELLQEIESIDDPKWKEDSYMEHVFVQLDIKVNFKQQEAIVIPWEPPEPPPTRSARLQKIETTTIFEKLFWDYLSKSNFMRENKKPHISETLDYAEVLKMALDPVEIIPQLAVNRMDVLKLLSQLTAEGIRDIAENWRFVPQDMYEV